MYRRSLLVLLVAVVALTGACGTDDDASTDPLPSTTTALRPSTAPLPSSTSSVPSSTDAQRFPDVIAVEVDRAPDGTARFDVTISSPYDSPDRYADAWRVLGPDGVDYGVASWPTITPTSSPSPDHSTASSSPMRSRS